MGGTSVNVDTVHRWLEQAAAALKAHIHSIIDPDAERPAIGHSVRVWGPTTDAEARAVFA